MPSDATPTSNTATAHDEREFAGRVALVTGGAGGIGRSVADALAARGASVIAADASVARDADARAFARGGRSDVHLDVAHKADVAALVERVVRDLGAIDLLVNVAGVLSVGAAEHLAEEEWDRVMTINLKGSFLACQAVIAPMKARGYGRIVNIGSVAGKNGGNARPWMHPEEQARSANVAYGVSKAGVHAMTAFLAKELAAHGITVNAVAPGPIATPMTTRFPDALRALIPVGRMGTLDNVVDAILFLASERSGYITGEVLDINGGLWCD